MSRADFEVNKLRRVIKQSGRSFVFERKGKNYFNEPTDENALEISINGLYHETVSHVSVLTSDGTAVRTKPKPAIMCLMSDAQQLENTDTIIINGRIHKVADVKDIHMMGVIAEISLEVDA